jgi:hypothetical protein
LISVPFAVLKYNEHGCVKRRVDLAECGCQEAQRWAWPLAGPAQVTANFSQIEVVRVKRRSGKLADRYRGGN